MTEKELRDATKSTSDGSNCKPKVNDGGPMFPRVIKSSRDNGLGHTVEVETTGWIPGASVRVWLAGQALAGLCANWHAMKSCDAIGIKVPDLAVLVADKTIAALEKGSK